MLRTEVDNIVKEAEDRMKAAIEAVRKHFASVRTGRAHPGLVEDLRVDYYGTKTPVKQLANITTPDPRSIVVQPWDKTSMEPIEKAIMTSDIGISPVNDGKVIRLSMPQLTAERRDELKKVLHRYAEEGKVSIRNSRHHAIDEAAKKEKEKLLTEDDKFLAKEKVEKVTKDYTHKIEELLEDKEKEIMQ